MAYTVRNGTSRQHAVQIAKVFCVSDVCMIASLMNFGH